MEINTSHFKELLESEQKQLEEELSTIGFHPADNPADWKAKPTDKESNRPDSNDEADAIANFETNTAILKQLEIRLLNVKRALGKIESGKYGIDEIDGENIEIERLEANPAARTSIKNREMDPDGVTK
ncbi:hypothetical protein COB55_04995 [Candidatus Wolfebacteria bacterium]|nr:MAG: hypothetical protein COB55_04995 [Candidatus Wolfebacteria bacterium]